MVTRVDLSMSSTVCIRNRVVLLFSLARVPVDEYATVCVGLFCRKTR